MSECDRWTSSQEHSIYAICQPRQNAAPSWVAPVLVRGGGRRACRVAVPVGCCSSLANKRQGWLEPPLVLWPCQSRAGGRRRISGNSDCCHPQAAHPWCQWGRYIKKARGKITHLKTSSPISMESENGWLKLKAASDANFCGVIPRFVAHPGTGSAGE